MNNSTDKPRNAALSYEDAHEVVNQLSELKVNELEGVTVYSGVHSQHGGVHIVIPIIGDGMLLLPFALQQF